MNKEFIILKEFDKQWNNMGLVDDDLRRLQLEILNFPELGVVVPGTGGLLKRRFAFDGLGKSGSARVCYVDFIYADKIVLVTAYPKSAKDNLSKAECNNIKKLIDYVSKHLR